MLALKKINKTNMKRILLIIMLHALALSCAQIYPIYTTDRVPLNAYIKDINNELLSYEGTWKGQWDNKVFYITFKRIKVQKDYSSDHIFYKDVLVGKFKVLTADEVLTIYDNTNLSDNNTKIVGSRFFLTPVHRYSLIYVDPDICSRSGSIRINFINSNQTQLNWKYTDTTDMLPSDCPYLNTPDPLPDPLPKEIILTKQ